MAAVEGGLLDALGLGGGGQLRADGGGGLDVAAVVHARRLGGAAGGGQRHALEVVDELGVNVLGAAEDAEARPLGRAGDAAADVPPSPQLPHLLCLLMVHDTVFGSGWRLAAAGEGLAFLAADLFVLVADAL